MKRIVSIFVLICFLVTGEVGTCPVYAQDFRLSAPGVMVHLSPDFNPPILKGIKVHPDNPFRFDFILDQGDSSAVPAKIESTRLIKYFLASLTIPEKDLWVNLSPYEKNRIIPQSFGLTEMGRDLLAEDYMLKQITASLIYPEDEIGKKFWKRIYEEAAKKFGTTNIPVNTFNKVWIVPEKAVVYENAKTGTAYVVESKLKVMLEQDYLALEKNQLPARGHVPLTQLVGTPTRGHDFSRVPMPAAKQISIGGESTPGKQPSALQETSTLGSQIVREIIIPELTTEVNEGKNFSQLRQVYNSLILATWYKKKIKDSILEQVYADKKKVAGVGYDQSIISVLPKGNAPTDVELIYQRYLQAFKKGAYNYIKEEQDPITHQVTPRKYFSGGFDAALISPMLNFVQASQLPKSSGMDRAQIVTVDCTMAQGEVVLKKEMIAYLDDKSDAVHRLVRMKFFNPLFKVARMEKISINFEHNWYISSLAIANARFRAIYLSDWFENAYYLHRETDIGVISDVQMAYLTAHEIIHIKKKHIKESPENEMEATLGGVDLLLAAGYKLEDIRQKVVPFIRKAQIFKRSSKARRGNNHFRREVCRES